MQSLFGNVQTNKRDDPCSCVVKSKTAKFDTGSEALAANFKDYDIGNITYIKLSENSYGKEAC